VATLLEPELTNEEYVKLGGKRCPHCGSIDFHSVGPIDTGNDEFAYQCIACETCSCVWYNRYQLVGFEDALDDPPNTDKEE
jgi:formate dehydrogenase maturation protein FdhE